MSELFDINKFDQYKEDNRREVKSAKGGLPRSLWETYSAFANCYGGVIILGVIEDTDGTWKSTGLKNERALLKEFWDVINNKNKVSLNLLSNRDVEIYVDGESENMIVAINVPMASRSQKPVYINNDIMNGTFRRNWEGDYHCSPMEVRAMLRDEPEETMDMKVLDVPLDYISRDSVEGYRMRHLAYKPGHPFLKLPYEEYLEQLGAATVSAADGKLHPTAAGLLMFGKEYRITREFPEYFLDYREMMDPAIRWTDRFQSGSGEWSGNLFDFFFTVYNKLIRVLKVPFELDGAIRVDDTPVHKAIREALANCLVNTDYYLPHAVVIKLYPDRIVMENPGCVRTGKSQMLKGGISDPRNKTIMKMFNLINIGERAGSGVPDIYSVWQEQGWEEPKVEESYGVDRTVLTLSFAEKKATKKSDEIKTTKKTDEIKATEKSLRQKEEVLRHMQAGVWYKTSQLSEMMGLGTTRMKELLYALLAEGRIVSEGNTKAKMYRKIG